MRALFIFDTVLIKDKENFFGMTLTHDFFQNKYLKYYDEITVSTRCKNSKEVNGNFDGYKITNGENVDVRPIESYKEIPDAIFKRKKVEQELLNVIERADIVIIRMPSVLGILACKICEKIDKKYLIEVVACAWDGYVNHTNWIGKLIAPIMFLKVRNEVKKAPKTLYVTDKFLQSRYPCDGQIVACSDVIIDVPKEEILEKRFLKIEENKNENQIKLCTVANIDLKYKGHEFVIKAISKLNKESKIKYKYYIVGARK